MFKQRVRLAFFCLGTIFSFLIILSCYAKIENAITVLIETSQKEGGIFNVNKENYRYIVRNNIKKVKLIYKDDSFYTYIRFDCQSSMESFIFKIVLPEEYTKMFYRLSTKLVLNKINFWQYTGKK